MYMSYCAPGDTLKQDTVHLTRRHFKDKLIYIASNAIMYRLVIELLYLF